jgi:orotate phosphoribosyltransferase
MTYGMKKGIDRMAEAGIEWVSLTDFDEVIEAAAEQGYISADNITALKAFRDDPSDESWIGK